MDELSQEQLAILKGASPDELRFTVDFARNYVAGKKWACWGARAVVALGMLAAAVAAILSLIWKVEGHG
jgi:hypothetical protein